MTIKNVDISQIAIYNNVSFGKKEFKGFIGYKDVKKIRPLCIFLPKITSNRKDFDENKFMSFFIKDDELSEKYNEIWDKLKIVSKKKSIVKQ